MSGIPHAVSAHWTGGWDESGLRTWAEDLRRSLGEQPVTFGLIFATPAFRPHAAELLDIVRVHARVPVLAGCSSLTVIAAGREHEGAEGVALSLFALPGARAQTFLVPPGGGDATTHARAEGAAAKHIGGWLAFLEPRHTDAESWIAGWQAAFPGAPIFGGIASGAPDADGAQVYANGQVLEAGGVALALSGVRLLGVVAQGCMPIGEVWTITRVDGNVVHRIGNRPAFAVLQETFDELPEETRARSRGNLFAGLVVDEYRDEFHRGDFLVRNIIGGDPDNGALAVGAFPRQGQTMQFQLRDAATADEDIRGLLGRLRDDLGRARIYGGCLCVCNGRGRALFGEEDHDAGLVHQMLGPTAVAGFFGNGEFGPVGSKSFVHGYTATLLLFAGPTRTPEDEL